MSETSLSGLSVSLTTAATSLSNATELEDLEKKAKKVRLWLTVGFAFRSSRFLAFYGFSFIAVKRSTSF